MRGHVEIVRLLLESSADRSIRNKQDKVSFEDATPPTSVSERQDEALNQQVVHTRNVECCERRTFAHLVSGFGGCRCEGRHDVPLTSHLHMLLISPSVLRTGARRPCPAMLVALVSLYQGGAGQLSMPSTGSHSELYILAGITCLRMWGTRSTFQLVLFCESKAAGSAT